jgi:hypothetical protein
MKSGRQCSDLDYSQYDKNNTLAFAMASMMFGEFTNIVVCRRLPDRRIDYLGGGKPYRIMQRYGDLKIKSSIITTDGFLRIMVE